jgi:hypothetical protein
MSKKIDSTEALLHNSSEKARIPGGLPALLKKFVTDLLKVG